MLAPPTSRQYLILVLLSAVAASAQLTNAPPCVLNCVLPAAAQSGCPISQAQCICTSNIFLAVSKACLESKCSPAEVKAAEAAQQKECATVNAVNATVSRVTQTVAITTMVPMNGASMTRNLDVSTTPSTSVTANATASGLTSDATCNRVSLYSGVVLVLASILMVLHI